MHVKLEEGWSLVFSWTSRFLLLPHHKFSTTRLLHDGMASVFVNLQQFLKEFFAGQRFVICTCKN
jgi:hypothetical protein